MELFYQLQGVLIGLIGWAATAILTMGSTRLNEIEQKALIVCSWALWMIPAMGALVYRGLMTMNTALLFCGATTVILGLMASLSVIRWRTKGR